MAKQTPGEPLDALLSRRGIPPDGEARRALAAWLPDGPVDLEHFADLALAALPHFARHSVSPSSEAARTVFRWLLADAPSAGAGLEGALALGLLIERQFHAAFADFFLSEEGEGERRIRRRIQRRLGHADGLMIESVLERIRDRRGHLLDHFRGRYQPSLFGPVTFDPERLPGYLAAVVRFESLHVPERERRTVQGKFQDLGWPDRALDEVDYFRLGQLLRDFWSEANGFTAEQGYEGLVSLALGLLADHPELRRRCKQFLRERLPAWEQAKERLQERISRLLAREEDLRARLASAVGEAREQLQAELEAVERKLERLDRQLTAHPEELRPRPHEVEKLLAGCVKRKASRLRYERLCAEVRLLDARACSGAEALLAGHGPALPGEVRRLLEEVPAHLGRRPMSTRGPNVAPEERARRGLEARLWLGEGEGLLARARAGLRSAHAADELLGESAGALVHWLQDVEDAYELTVVSRKGILGAPGRRHGERLRRLLRVGG